MIKGVYRDPKVGLDHAGQGNTTLLEQHFFMLPEKLMLEPSESGQVWVSLLLKSL